MYEFKAVSNDVLQEISFTINKGDKVIIFGPSGSGKSTLLHLFNRLKDPNEGEILFNGKSLFSYSVPTLRRRVGLVLQAPHLFPGTVLDNIKFGPSLCNKWKDKDASPLLSYVQLSEDYLHKPADELSGGEKQRVSLARTLANEPDVLLLDEPTSALDQKTTEEIEHVLTALINDKDLTMVMVTHNLSQAKRLGNRGIFLIDGRVVEDGNLPGMLDKPKSEELKLFLQ